MPSVWPKNKTLGGTAQVISCLPALVSTNGSARGGCGGSVRVGGDFSDEGDFSTGGGGEYLEGGSVPVMAQCLDHSEWALEE